MTQGPTHQFCPKCSAMLPPHLKVCPRCGQDLANPNADISGKEIFQITGVVLLIAIVPFIILMAAAAICVASAR